MLRRLNLALLICSVIGTSCSTPLEIVGDYRLSEADLQQIKLLVAERSDIRKPILRIFVERPDRARVTTGRDYHAGDIFNDFIVAKRGGQWHIASKIEEERIIVTGN